MNKVYKVISERIEARLQEGVAPWRKPWAPVIPFNMVSRKQYRGTNVFMCWMSEFEYPGWLSFKQLTAMGGNVKGQKGTPITFWNWFNKPDPTPDDPDNVKRIPFLRYYTCWNGEQVSGIDLPTVPGREHEPIAECERIVEGYENAPPVRINGNRAYYSPSNDIVGMPPTNTFASDASYYATLFHEYAHSTGHSSRLNRFDPSVHDQFGSASYSEEELTAELTASFLAGVAGVERETIDNTAAYCQGWLRALQDDKQMFVLAAQRAQKAADHILGTTFEQA